MRHVTLKQLRALAGVLRCGTLSEAARQLRVTPPAVSLQLRLLEESVGLPLIDRTGDGPRPTQAGKEILLAIDRIETALGECRDALEALKSLDGGRVAVGVVSTAKYFAPRALAAFAKSHPRMDIRLSIGNRQETIAALESYRLDIAIMGRAPEGIAVADAVIGPHPHIIIGPPDHPLTKRRRLALEDLASETFLLREMGSGTRMLMERLFASHGLKPKIGMEIGSNETIKQAVMAGLGVALISAHTVAAEIEDHRLSPFDVLGLPLMRKWFVVRRADKRMLPAAQALWDFLHDNGARYLPTLDLPDRSSSRPRKKTRRS
ncbi:MAG: LysR substrate-binding domain-containing protein [Pseudomonadota bacterium]